MLLLLSDTISTFGCSISLNCGFLLLTDNVVIVGDHATDDGSRLGVLQVDGGAKLACTY